MSQLILESIAKEVRLRPASACTEATHVEQPEDG
jgi:hypothetical protein